MEEKQPVNPQDNPKNSTPPVWWARWEFLLGLLATLAGITGVTLKDFFTSSASDNPISLTVFAYDAKKGQQHPALRAQGHIVLDVNGERKQEAIDDKGKAVFHNLRIGDQVRLDVAFSEPYRVFWPDSVYAVTDAGQIYLPVELKNLEKLRGHVFYQDKPIPNVIVALDNLRDTSDALGYYELKIPPELQKREQKLLIHHPDIGTQTETVYPQTDQDWDFMLKK